MATKTAAELGIKAPAGGFEDLGWYTPDGGKGYQYYQGTFADTRETIHPNSPQQGAGQIVNLGGSNNNVATISEPNNPSGVNDYLNSFGNLVLQQNKQLEEAANFRSDEQIVSDIKSIVTPSQPRPEPVKLADLYQTLMNQGDVKTLEDRLAQLMGQEQEIYATLQIRSNAEKNKQVATNVIAGRLTEVQQQAQEDLMMLNIVKTTVQSQLTSKYKMIDTVIQLTGQDNQTAIQMYNDEFNQNMQIYQQFRADKQAQLDTLTKMQDRTLSAAEKMTDWKIQMYKYEQDSARSNLQVYANLIKDGNFDMNKLTGDQKLEIQKLETLSGLGTGFLSAVRREVGSGSSLKFIDGITHTDETGTMYRTVIYTDGSGQIKTKDVLVGSNAGEKMEISQQQIESAVSIMKSKDTNGDGYLSAEEQDAAGDDIAQLVKNEATARDLTIRAWELSELKQWQP